MRIISGKWGGRRFTPPADKWPTRPTTDMSKEGLFNILNNYLHFDQIVMLDLFGGTGNHCYEFLSRGCTDATYVDQHGPAVRFVQKMAKTLKVDDHLTIVKGDVARFLAQPVHRKYDYVFAGPPYPLTWLDEIPDRLFAADLLSPDAIFVLEHNQQHDFTEHPRFWQVRNYGQTHFSFFTAPE